MVDSLGLLELMTALQEHCGREIDFDALDPEQMTVVGPLCNFVAGEMAKG
jgi:acyl carrier protein